MEFIKATETTALGVGEKTMVQVGGHDIMLANIDKRPANTEDQQKILLILIT